MFDVELNSFIVKFHQLRSAGRYAHLDLHCEGGQSFVSLRVQLGEAGQQPHHRHHQQVRRGLRRSPAYHRRQERRKAARQAAEAEDATPPVQAPVQEVETEEVPAVEVPVPDVSAKGTLAAEEAEVVAPSVIINSECRKVKSRDKWMKEDIGLIEAVIIDTVTSLENVYEDRFVRCRHCKRLSKDVVFYDHHCERQPGYHQFHEDVRVMLDPDQAEVAAICSL